MPYKNKVNFNPAPHSISLCFLDLNFKGVDDFSKDVLKSSVLFLFSFFLAIKVFIFFDNKTPFSVP